jgi:iron-sulfur cluster assembly accessory protein
MIITDSAQKQLNELLADGECLEIGLKGGGCNGLMITLEKTNSTDTTELSIGDKTKFADQMSQKYLQGGSLDYEDKGFSKTFVVNPSKGTARCGCGDSIAIPQV